MQLNPKQHEQWAYPLIAALIPLFAQSIWLWHNTQLPISDTVEEFGASYHIYTLAVHHEWLKFIASLYDARNLTWRPIGFYILLVPFQLISGGNILFTAGGVTLTCTLISCFYIYRLLRLAATPPLAIFATAFLGILPGFQWPSTFLAFAECAFFPAILATVYHLIRSDYLRDKHHSIGFVIAVAVDFILRPIESINHVGLLLVIFLIMAWRKKVIGGEQLYRIVLGFLISVSFLVIVGWLNRGVVSHSRIFADAARGKFFARLGAAAVISTLALWTGNVLRRATLWVRSGRLSHYLEPPYAEVSFFAIYALIVLFYFRYVPELVGWLYSCSFGDLTIYLEYYPLPRLLKGFVMATGQLPFYGITALSLAAFFFCLTPEKRKELLHHKLLYLFTIIPLTLLMTLCTSQFWQRKVAVIFDIYMLAMIIPVLLPGKFYRLRLGALTLMAAVQFYSVLWISLGHPIQNWMALITGSKQGFPLMVTASPNPNIVIKNFIEATAQHNGYKSILTPIETSYSILNPFQLSMLVGIEENGIYANIPFITFYDVNQPIKPLTDRKADAFLLVNDSEGKLLETPEAAAQMKRINDKTAEPNEKMRITLSELYAEGKFEALGIKKSACIYVDSINREACIFQLPKISP